MTGTSSNNKDSCNNRNHLILTLPFSSIKNSNLRRLCLEMIKSVMMKLSAKTISLPLHRLAARLICKKEICISLRHIFELSTLIA